MSKLSLLAGALVIVGGLNWGLVAVAEFDLVATLVGLSAVFLATQLPALGRDRHAELAPSR